MLEHLRANGYPEITCRPIKSQTVSPDPFWSVVIPIHNRVKHLAQCVASVASQFGKHDGVEVILAITDQNQSDVFDEVFKAAGGIRHLIECHKFDDDLGAICNWNRAIGLTRGRWVHLLHDDDWVEPGFYKTLREGIAHQDVGIASTGWSNFMDFPGHEVDGKSTISNWASVGPGVVDPKGWRDCIGVGNPMNLCAVVVKRETYERLGLFHPDIPYVADWEFLQRAACHVQWWSAGDKPLARYRQHGDSGTTGADPSSKYRDIRWAKRMAQSYWPADEWPAVAAASRQHWLKDALEKSFTLFNVGRIDDSAAVLQEATRLVRELEMPIPTIHKLGA